MKDGGQKDGIRIQCNTENIVPIVVPGLSSSSSGSSSTSKIPSRQESHSSSPSTSSSSPAVSEIQSQERGDRIESDFSPVQVSTSVDDRSGQPDDTQANKTPKQKNPRRNRVNRCVLRSWSGCKNSGKFWWMMKFQYTEILTPVLLMKFL